MTITIPTMSPFPGRGAAPEDYIAQADTTMQQLPGVIASMNELGSAFNLGAGVLAGGYLVPAPYAAGIHMTLAAHAIKPLTTILEHRGQILSDYLNHATKDPIVRDNIHQSAYGNRLDGYAWAAAVGGVMNPAVHRSLPRQPINAAWAGAAANMAVPGNEVHFSVDNGDRVTWFGWCKLNGVATPGQLTEVAQLPRALWPDGPVRVTVTATPPSGPPIGEAATVFVTGGGVVSVWFSSALPGGFYIDGLSYTRAFTQVTR